MQITEIKWRTTAFPSPPLCMAATEEYAMLKKNVSCFLDFLDESVEIKLVALYYLFYFLFHFQYGRLFNMASLLRFFFQCLKLCSPLIKWRALQQRLWVKSPLGTALFHRCRKSFITYVFTSVTFLSHRSLYACIYIHVQVSSHLSITLK